LTLRRNRNSCKTSNEM